MGQTSRPGDDVHLDENLRRNGRPAGPFQGAHVVPGVAVRVERRGPRRAVSCRMVPIEGDATAAEVSDEDVVAARGPGGPVMGSEDVLQETPTLVRACMPNSMSTMVEMSPTRPGDTPTMVGRSIPRAGGDGRTESPK